MSKVSAIYHIVINTKYRRMVIPKDVREELHKYITGIVHNNHSELITINGIENHLHMLIDLSPTISLSDMMKTIKQSTSTWLKANPECPYFEGWGREYFAFSVSYSSIDSVKRYIANQEEHHKHHSFEDELRATLALLKEEWQEHYLT